MKFRELRNKVLNKKNLKIGIALVLLYGLWWLFWPITTTYLNMKSHILMTGDTYELNDIYRPYIEKITFVDGHFILFMTKPRLFKTRIGYIYTSNDGANWIKIDLLKDDWPKNAGIYQFMNIPVSYKKNCLMFSNITGGVYSKNCINNWKPFDTKFSSPITEGNSYITDVTHQSA